MDKQDEEADVRYTGKNMYGHPTYHIGALPPPKQDDELMEQEWLKTWRKYGRRIDRVDYFQKGWQAHARKSVDRLKEAERMLRYVRDNHLMCTELENDIEAFLNEQEDK